MLLHWFAVGIINSREREQAPKSVVGSVMRVRECVRVRSPYEVLPFPFTSHGAGVEYMRERYKSRKRRVARIPLLSLCLRGPIGPVDDAGSVPTPLPGATCDVRLNRTGGMGPRRAR
jgi:hypothetical protein